MEIRLIMLIPFPYYRQTFESGKCINTAGKSIINSHAQYPHKIQTICLSDRSPLKYTLLQVLKGYVRMKRIIYNLNYSLHSHIAVYTAPC